MSIATPEEKDVGIKDLQLTINSLEHSAGFQRTEKEREALDLATRVARGKGISLPELEGNLRIAKRKLRKSLDLYDEFIKHSSIKRATECFNLMAEVIIEVWDFYSPSTRNFLKAFAQGNAKFLDEPEPSNWQEIRELTTEHKKAVQRLINSINGGLEWANCSTELGRKLLTSRREILLSGERLMNLEEFDKYLDERREVEVK